MAKINYKSAQEVADFFHVYMARDSVGTWHGFKNEPILKSQMVYDDEGNQVLAGYWKPAEEEETFAMVFLAGIYDNRPFNETLTIPAPKVKKNSSELQPQKKKQFNKKPQNNRKFNNKKIYNNYRGESNNNEHHEAGSVIKPQGISKESSEALKRLFG